MPPKKSGDSSTGGGGGSIAAKRKHQESKARPRSWSPTPSGLSDGPAAANANPGASNGASSSSHENVVISFTPMNAPKGAGVVRSGKPRNSKNASHSALDLDSDDIEDDDWIKGSSKHSRPKNQPPSTESPSNGGAVREADASTPASRGPKRKKSLKLKELGGALSQAGDKETAETAESPGPEAMAEADGKKKGRKSAGRQLTLLDHFRQETRAPPPPVNENAAKAAKERTSPAGASSEGQTPNPKLKIKFRGLPKPADPQTVSPSNFYGGAPDTPATTAGRGKAHKGTANGAAKETLVLPTNPPSDALSENLPSPPATAELSETAAIMAMLDAHLSNRRGRRTTRNAAPCYSGFPAAVPASPPAPSASSAPAPSTTMTSTTSRNTSPNPAPPPKSGKKSTRSVSPQRRGRRNTEPTRSVSPRRAGKANITTATATQTPASLTPVDTTALDASLAKAAANDRRGRARTGRKLVDDFSNMIDIEPPKQQPSYHPRAPSSYEYGMMPLGVLPLKERVDEVFNKPVPKEPEARSDLTSSHQFSNLWGTAGNKEVTIMKGNQGRAKRMFQKAEKLDNNNDWVFADTEGAILVKVIDQDDNISRARGKSKPHRRRLSMPFGLDTSVSPSPSFTQDHPARSTEELVSPISDNVPETPQEVGTMQIDEPGFEVASKQSEAPIVVGDAVDMVPSEVSEAARTIKEPLAEPLAKPLARPQLLAIIKEAKYAAEKAKNMETLNFLLYLEATGSEYEMREALKQMLNREYFSQRFSPVTVPGGKRTVWQREEDEGTVDSKEPIGKRQRVLSPYAPPVRAKRPDALDDSISNNLDRVVEQSRARIAALDAKYVPEEFTCLRGEPDDTSPDVCLGLEDRGFDTDDKAWGKDYFKYKMGSIVKDSNDAEAEGTTSNGRTKRRRNDKERYEDAEDEEMLDASETADHLMDDEESPCTVCGGVGAPLVICDGLGCKEEQHYGCAIPPLTQAQVDAMPEWFCRKCTIKRLQPSRKAPDGKGMFARLFEVVDKSNPRTYELPKAIREAFTGVETGELGAYKESIDFYDLTKTKDKELRAWDHLRRLNDQPFEKQMLGSDGGVAVCYGCREGRLRTDRGQLLACDYCTQYWHQDCLKEPIVEPPAIKAFGERPEDHVLLMKWKCPLHVPHDAYPTRQLRRPNEGRDVVWPPTHRIPKEAPPPPDVSSQNFMNVSRNGKELVVPEAGVTLSFLPNVNKAKEQKALNERVFTGQELQAIEGLRSLRVRSQPQVIVERPVQVMDGSLAADTVLVNPLVNFILSNVPDHIRPGVEASIVEGEFERDHASQINLIRALQESLNSKLQKLTRQDI